ncbi:unnamed protein product [Orchesella dallaii]|uniref:G-protein coupled receptors family 1 profile domain-containing protein n=1 Tax=Orchesella dallaii TaxID=48710 RepID=A0ABP1Q2E5_9HEXA
MQLLTHVKLLLIYCGILGSTIFERFHINFLQVDASLLQIRMIQPKNDDVSGGQGIFIKGTSDHIWKNVSAAEKKHIEELQLEQVTDEESPISDVLLDTEETETTTDLLINSFNISDEKESRFSPPIINDDNGSDSEEVLISLRNDTGRFGWTDLGWADVALVTLFCSIIAGTVAGNMLVIAAVVTTRRLRTVTNCFVMSLAVADWLVGMFVMPPKVFLYLVDNEWRFGRIICELWISLDILLCTASILSLCAISIDRYLAITRPLAYSRRRRSKRLALSMISCVWIAAVVITSPPIFGWYEENRNTDNKCDYNENTGYVVYSALGSFFLPLFVMLYVYARIACVITRRQRSIQKLHSRGDRKSQYCGSDVEEPLHQKDRDDEGGKGENAEKQLHKPTTRLSSSATLTGEGGEADNQDLAPQSTSGQVGHHHKFGERQSATTQPRTAYQESNSFLGRLRLSSCTAADSDDGGGSKSKKKSGEHPRQDKHGASSQDKESNPAANSALALSLPDPATLASGSGTENSSSSTVENESTCGCSHSNNVAPLPLQQNSHRSNNCCSTHNRRHSNHHHYVSRMKTGSRLCHHSVATASPQKNIHRVHQTSSASGRSFGDDELHPKSDGSCRSLDRSPRVWTVEATSPPSGGKRKGKPSKLSNVNCKSCSYEQALNESAGSAPDKSPSQMESVMMMECSPAGNPASLMSAASASGNNTNISPSPLEKSVPYSNRIHQSRIYQPHNLQHHRVIQNSQLENPNHLSSGMHRGRSMKFGPHVHGGEQNNFNGGTATRDFSSGRIASFKRETKTAQTLAAVVGGFIICWLPFFVAYVMGPFVPSSEAIPTGLMDALIWLGKKRKEILALLL